MENKQIKLYTEEQVRMAIEITLRDNPSIYSQVIECITPIKMPDDFNIELASNYFWDFYEYEDGNLYSTTYKGGFIGGAKWVIEQIKKQSDGK